MNIKRIDIAYKRNPTENMVAVGIHGKFTVNIVADDDTIVFQGNEVTLRCSKAGDWYIEEPYREYEKDGMKKKAYYFRLFAGMERSARDKAIGTIVNKAKQEFSVDKAPVSAGSSSSSTPSSEEDPFA